MIRSTVVTRLLPAIALASAACHADIADVDSAYYRWDGRQVHCAIDIDTITRNDRASIDRGLDRAVARGEVLELFAHVPGQTIALDAIETIVADAQARGLAFVTYADLANDTVPHGGGLALAFDDNAVDAWLSTRDVLQRYGARVTFFVTRYARLTDAAHQAIAQLAADGHDIEAHSVNHLRGPKYVDDHGLHAYIADEIAPSIDVLVADGYPITTFAYPFGARTDETDVAIARLDHVKLLRSVSFAWHGLPDSPCPY